MESPNSKRNLMTPQEKNLIKSHIKTEKIKLWFSVVVTGICLILLIISGVTPSFKIEQKILGWVVAGATMVLSSTKIKTLKDIIDLK